MKIEIWSDVLCPFCYIGKRNLETALAEFADKDQIEIEWKSFQLDPHLPEVATEDYKSYLKERKGMDANQVEDMLARVTEMAAQVGLDYRFDQAVMVSSQKAHRLIQFAKTKGLGDQIEERLFKAFFTEGQDIANTETLTQLGMEIGLPADEIQTAFTDDQYALSVSQDIQEAQSIGVTGVPFFVFNRKYGASGAQPPSVFLETLNKSYTEWKEANPEPKLHMTSGNSCDIDGNCN